MRIFGPKVRVSLGSVVALLGLSSCDLLGNGGVVQIASSGDFTCALTKIGDVYCWGDAARTAQTRDPTTLPPPKRTAPEKVASISGATFLDVAGSYGCAVLKGGGVACFAEHGLEPLEMPAVEGATRVSLAPLHGVVQKADGTVFHFARPGKTVPTLTPIEGLGAVKEALTGEEHGCALVEGGKVKCWGSPALGALGDVEPGEGNVPRALQSLHDVKSLAVGRATNCVVDAESAVRCWGSNSFGQTGQAGVGYAGPPVVTPARVPFLSRAIQVEVGNLHACAILEGGAVTCWGSDEYGQSGRVQHGVAIVGLKDVTQLALGEHHSCALGKSGHVKCWGRALRGNLGNGSTVDSAVPVDVNVPH